MKFKLSILFIALLVLYMLIPVGEYGIRDVGIYTGNSKTSQIKMSAGDFIEKVENTINPVVSAMVIPVTSIGRDGENHSLTGRINSGQYYFSGSAHGALDILLDGTNTAAACPYDNSSKPCPDTAMIAPFNGTITYINEPKGAHYNHYNNNHSCTSIVRIEGEGEWEGYRTDIVHVKDLGPDIKVGSKITQGDFVGFICSQGNSTAPHLHLNVFQGGAKVKNPGLYMDSLIWHESIEDAIIYNLLKVPNQSGFTEEQFVQLNEREKYSSTVTIPDKYKK